MFSMYKKERLTVRKMSLVTGISVLLILTLLAGCSNKESRTIRSGNEAAPLTALQGKELPEDQARFDSYVYSVEKLKKEYNNVIVLDARTKEEYDKGHLPNAVQAHWTDWSNVQVKQGEKGWAEILPNDVLKEKLGKLGIDGSKPVIIYNDPLVGWGEEGRQLWTLRVFGLENTYILNGGLKLWKESGGEVITEAPVIQTVNGPEPKPNLDLFASTDYLSSNLDNLKVIDSREDEEYAGVKTYGEKQKGRIPNSEHIWFKDYYNSDGTLQTPAQIRARVESVGYKTSDEIVNYCTGGIRSGFATVALKLAGFANVKNYNVSFSEWTGTGQKVDTKVYEKLNK